jgi:hypothetical protein
MKKHEHKKSLSLSTETVRALREHEMKATAGGGWTLYYSNCDLCPVSGTPNHCITGLC